MANKDFVTLGVVKSLLDVQSNAYKQAFRMMFHELKDEIKTIRSDITDLKQSLSFSQGQLDTTMNNVKCIDQKILHYQQNFKDIGHPLDTMDSNLEYMENQSRRNNVKIMGVPEDKKEEKNWDDTENLVKKLIAEKLDVQDNVEIERCHRVNHKRNINRSGRLISKDDEKPRNIVDKFASWKVKERVLKKAREIGPANIKFVADLSQKTLDKRAAQIDNLKAARSAGKTAYFILDRLVIKDKPPDRQSVAEHHKIHAKCTVPEHSDEETTFGTSQET